MFKEFKEFAMRGSVVDMAVGIIIGAAFGTIVTSLVADVLMPPIGLLLGKVDFANLYILLSGAGPTFARRGPAAGAVTLNYGEVHQQDHQLPHRRLRALPGHPRREPDEEESRSPRGRADDQGLPLLRHGRPDQGRPLPALHLGAEEVAGSPDQNASWAVM